MRTVSAASDFSGTPSSRLHIRGEAQCPPSYRPSRLRTGVPREPVSKNKQIRTIYITALRARPIRIGKDNKQTPRSTRLTKGTSKTAEEQLMSTSKKAPQTIRQGGPGASHENAKAPLEVKKPPADDERRNTSRVSGGGGERDRHHTHNPGSKGGKL